MACSKSCDSLRNCEVDGDWDLVVGGNDGKLLYFENQNGTFVPLEGDANPFDGSRKTACGVFYANTVWDH